jgi:eukaryotic-like serine/threonine-protein kinase
MTPERWQQIKGVLDLVLELKPAQRSAFLDQACNGDQSLRQEVELFLAGDSDGEDGFLEKPWVSATIAEDATQSWVGRRIGSYEVIEMIGEGGMGSVYRAARADEQYKKQVAIKVVKRGLDTPFALARFRAERQILANLEHPNIARLLDGGTTDAGLPYVVMELVDGLPIDENCDSQKLSIEERLRTFRTVCLAVQYAHQHMVIHRDLKPGNILVTADGIPKLLDFGIAKILDPGSFPSGAQATISLMRMLTPEYASPEQVRGDTISAASDVYSLGVVLFILLTGGHPFRFDNRSPDAMARVICDTDPPKPSTAVRRTTRPASGTAAQQSSGRRSITSLVDSPEKLSKQLRGDLDNIVLMALRKDPLRRYASAEQLAEDIRRYLVGLPVLAHEDSLAYRAGKFVRRNKLGVAAAVLLVLSLAGGLVATLWQAHIAKSERARAERRFNDVRKLANSLIFEVHDSIRDLPGATAARKLVMQRAQEYLDSLAKESSSDPALLQELAAAYGRLASVQGSGLDVNLGDTTGALQNRRKATQLLETAASLQPANPTVLAKMAQSYLALAVALYRTGDDQGSEDCEQKALHILEPLAAANADDKNVQYALAKAYESTAGTFRSKGDLVRAGQSFQKALDIEERLGSGDPQNQLYQREISFSHKHLGGTLMEQNKLSEALEQYRAALVIDEAQLARNPDSVQDRYNITFTYNDTGLILGKQGNFDSALAYYHKAFEIRAALVAADPNDNRTLEGLSNTLNYMGFNLFEKKDYRGALESYRKALGIRENLSQKDPANQRLRFALADTESKIGNTYSAMALSSNRATGNQLKYCRESLEWNKRSLPTWMERKTQGKLGPDAETLAMSTRNIEECNRVVARLHSTKKPPAQ